MDFNITLFLQVINFLITYVFLHNFFFKPVLARLKAKKEAQQSLTDAVAREQAILASKEKEKTEKIHSFQEKIVHDYQAPTPTCEIVELDLAYIRNKKEIASLVSKAKNLIVKRLPHVD